MLPSYNAVHASRQAIGAILPGIWRVERPSIVFYQRSLFLYKNAISSQTSRLPICNEIVMIGAAPRAARPSIAQALPIHGSLPVSQRAANFGLKTSCFPLTTSCSSIILPRMALWAMLRSFFNQLYTVESSTPCFSASPTVDTHPPIFSATSKLPTSHFPSQPFPASHRCLPARLHRYLTYILRHLPELSTHTLHHPSTLLQPLTNLPLSSALLFSTLAIFLYVPSYLNPVPSRAARKPPSSSLLRPVPPHLSALCFPSTSSKAPAR